MALFEELSQAFSLVEVEPYGRVLVVPSKAFRQEWLPRLERENVKVYSGAHDGQACFFLKAETVQEPSKPLSLENASRLSAWSSEETEALLRLRSESLTFEEICRRLGKTEGACYSKWKGKNFTFLKSRSSTCLCFCAFSRMLEEGGNGGYYDDCHGEQC